MYMGRHVGFSACSPSKPQQQLSEDRSWFTCAPGLALHDLGNKPHLGGFLAPGISGCPRKGNTTAEEGGMLRLCWGFGSPEPGRDLFPLAGEQTSPGDWQGKELRSC